MLIPILPELSEEVKEAMWSVASLIQLGYLLTLAAFMAVGSLYAVGLVAQLWQTRDLGLLPTIGIYALGLYVAQRAFREEVRIEPPHEKEEGVD